MAVYKVKMPTGHLGSYKVKMPTGHLGRYKVKFPSLITIDMTGAPPLASWTLRNSVPEIVDTGDTERVRQDYPPDAVGYTLTWEDTAFPWEPPPPEGPMPLAGGELITFGPP